MDIRFKERCKNQRKTVDDVYIWRDRKIGKGTYGLVFKAQAKDPAKNEEEFALKMIEGHGLTLSACREISLLRELNHKHVIALEAIFLSHSDLKVYLAFKYAEYDFYTVVKYHRNNNIEVKAQTVKSMMRGLIDGIRYLHDNWVIHRDLKPANVLIMGEGPERGMVKVADLGFARLFHQPLKPLADIDPVVVTYWYRSPELLLGARHYTKTIDMWAIGCIFAEILSGRPIFTCNADQNKFASPYHPQQFQRIMEEMGYPSEQDWPDMKIYPEFPTFQKNFRKKDFDGRSLKIWAHRNPFKNISSKAFYLLKKFLAWDPNRRISAEVALNDDYFKEEPLAKDDCFYGELIPYPKRVCQHEDKTKDIEKNKHVKKTEENKSKRVQQNSNELQEKRLKLEANRSKLTGCAQKHQLKQNKSRLLTMSKVNGHNLNQPNEVSNNFTLESQQRHALNQQIKHKKAHMTSHQRNVQNISQQKFNREES